MANYARAQLRKALARSSHPQLMETHDSAADQGIFFTNQEKSSQELKALLEIAARTPYWHFSYRELAVMLNHTK